MNEPVRGLCAASKEFDHSTSGHSNHAELAAQDKPGTTPPFWTSRRDFFEAFSQVKPEERTVRLKPRPHSRSTCSRSSTCSLYTWLETVKISRAKVRALIRRLLHWCGAAMAHATAWDPTRSSIYNVDSNKGNKTCQFLAQHLPLHAALTISLGLPTSVGRLACGLAVKHAAGIKELQETWLEQRRQHLLLKSPTCQRIKSLNGSGLQCSSLDLVLRICVQKPQIGPSGTQLWYVERICFAAEP